MFFSIFSLVSLSSSSCATTQRIENEHNSKIDELNKEIEYLEDLKQGIEGRAVKYENQAQRLQFYADQLVEAKRYWEMAKQSREAAKELDKKIAEKKKERDNLLRLRGE